MGSQKDIRIESQFLKTGDIQVKSYRDLLGVGTALIRVGSKPNYMYNKMQCATVYSSKLRFSTMVVVAHPQTLVARGILSLQDAQVKHLVHYNCYLLRQTDGIICSYTVHCSCSSVPRTSTTVRYLFCCIKHGHKQYVLNVN